MDVKRGPSQQPVALIPGLVGLDVLAKVFEHLDSNDQHCFVRTCRLFHGLKDRGPWQQQEMCLHKALSTVTPAEHAKGWEDATLLERLHSICRWLTARARTGSLKIVRISDDVCEECPLCRVHGPLSAKFMPLLFDQLEAAHATLAIELWVAGDHLPDALVSVSFARQLAPHLQYLSLRLATGSHFTSQTWEAICWAEGLRILEIDLVRGGAGEDGIAEMPPSIGNLRQLEELEIRAPSDEFFRYTGVVVSPELSQLTKLTSITLEAASLDCLHAIAGVASLCDLEMDDPRNDPFLDVPAELSRLSSLTFLSCCNSRFDESVSNLSALINLQVLSCRFGQSGAGLDDMDALDEEWLDVYSIALHAISQLSRLTCLVLSHWDHASDWTYSLSLEDVQKLQQLTGLVTLDISHMGMKSFHGTASWGNLQYLDVSHNWLPGVPNFAGLTSLTALKFGFQRPGLQFTEPLTFLDSMLSLQQLDVRPMQGQVWSQESRNFIEEAIFRDKPGKNGWLKIESGLSFGEDMEEFICIDSESSGPDEHEL